MSEAREGEAAIVVLNVNDDRIARYTFARMLARAGMRVVDAASGREALAQAREAPPDLVLLDVKLPDVDGFEVCQLLKGDRATAAVPVLLSSASFTSTASRVEGLGAGADGYLVQPVEAIELIATVRALVRARRAEDERAGLILREQAAREGAEQALRLADEARLAAEDANRLKDEFLAIVSHELRTPLNAILGWADLLRNDELPPAQRSHAAAVIARNARSQAQIIGDILDVSRILSGKLRIDLRPLDLTGVVEEAIDTVRPTAVARGVALSLVVAPSLAGAEIHGDPDRLQQVAWNLLSNAIKFTDRGGRVEARLGHADDQVELSVTDTGRGIEPAFLPHVFDRFRQADSSTVRNHGGLGLGLSIVRYLVELHGGRVQVSSDGPGKGSTFVVRFPRRVGARETSALPPSVVPVVATEAPLAQPLRLDGLRVLVVDDEPDARALVQEVLRRAGARVEVAGSVREALTHFDGTWPDVLLSDIAMPFEDGYALLERVRRLGPDHGGAIPAAAFTAFARAEDVARSHAAGFDAHLVKPLSGVVLVETVARLGGRRGTA